MGFKNVEVINSGGGTGGNAGGSSSELPIAGRFIDRTIPASISVDDRSAIKIGALRNAPVVVTAGRKTYLFGGNSAAGGTYATRSFFIYDHDTHQIVEQEPTPRVMSAAEAVHFEGKIYIFGGTATATSGFDIYDIATGKWDSRAFPRIVFNHMVGIIEKKIYIIGGAATNGGAPVTNIDIYDIETDTLSAGTPMNVARRDAITTSYNGKIYIFGGYSGSAASNNNLSYDGSSWASLSSGPSAVIYTYNMAASYTFGLEINGKLHYSNGSNGSMVYDVAANSWTSFASAAAGGIPNGFAASRNADGSYSCLGCFGVLADGILYESRYTGDGQPSAVQFVNLQCPGRGSLQTFYYKNKIYMFGVPSVSTMVPPYVTIYDIQTGATKNGANPPDWTSAMTRTGQAGAILDGKVYLAGGMEGTTALRRLDVYDIETDTWTTKSLLNAARRDATAFIYQRKLYVFGGLLGSQYTGSMEIYDIDRDYWSVSKINHVSGSNAVTATTPVVYKDKVYFIAGIASVIQSTIYAYDPQSDSMSGLLASLSGQRGVVAAVEKGGLIYVFGGSSVGTNLQMTEVFNPANNTVTTREAYTSVAPGSPKADLLEDGNIIIYATGLTPNPIRYYRAPEVVYEATAPSMVVVLQGDVTILDDTGRAISQVSVSSSSQQAKVFMAAGFKVAAMPSANPSRVMLLV